MAKSWFEFRAVILPLCIFSIILSWTQSSTCLFVCLSIQLEFLLHWPWVWHYKTQSLVWTTCYAWISPCPLLQAHLSVLSYSDMHTDTDTNICSHAHTHSHMHVHTLWYNQTMFVSPNLPKFSCLGLGTSSSLSLEYFLLFFKGLIPVSLQLLGWCLLL